MGLPCLADDLDDVKARGVLRWGADQEGGGPYVYPRDDDPTRVTGFEVELADAVAAELGVKAELAQGNWDKLPDLLRVGQLDVILNGYELTPERAAAMTTSKPYYLYALQLLVRDKSGLDWDKLAMPAAPKRKIGVLTGSAAETVARERLGEAMEIVSYDGNTDAMREVETKKLDATLQDTPIAAFYGPRFPALTPSGEPIAEGKYVIYARANQARLIEGVDLALRRLYERGELERIYRRYGLWSPRQRALGPLLGATPTPAPSPSGAPASGTDTAGPTGEPGATDPEPIRAPERKRGLAVVRDYGGVLLASAGMTVLLSIVSFPLAIALGLAVAIGRLHGPRWLRPLLTVYVETLRGTPLMLQLFVIFFFLPEIGVRFSAFTTAILGLAINYSAYESEIYRAGLSAVPEGQLEAALSLGMSKWQALRHVLVPQATRVVIPPVVNDFVALFKDTSVCSVVTIVELTKRYSVLSMSTQATVELTALTALLYLSMSVPLSVLSRRLERRLAPTSQVKA